MDALGAANRYPEFVPDQLRRLIAAHLHVADEQVIVGSGATGVALQVLHAVTSPGDRMVFSAPTFDGYPILADMARLSAVSVPLDDHGMHDLGAMADAAADARVVVLCRPHNPSGTVERGADVERFLQRVPADTVVLLDEAYIEFAATEHHLDGPALIRRHPNLVIIRTFSKAYGLAGLRIGYGFSAPDLAGRMWAMQLPFGIPSTSLAAVAASYAAHDELRQRIRAITRERRYLRAQLTTMGVRSTDSHANFLYLPATDGPWHHVFDDSGVRVRSYRDGQVRITIGNRASTHAVLAAVDAAHVGTRRGA